MDKKKPIKTFARRPIPVQLDSPKLRSSSIDSILGDENVELQDKINQVIQEELAPKRKQVTTRSDFMEELEALSSDEEEEIFMYGAPRASKTVKTVHELVEAGENSRFFDEIEYFAEGLRTGSEKSRTLTLEDLLAKVFTSPGFGARMRAHGMLGKSIGNIFEVKTAKVRESLGLLIIYLCHDIRKFEAFISIDRLCSLASDLLLDSADLSAKYLTYLNQTPVLKDFQSITSVKSCIMGLWLLAKLCQSISQSSSKEELLRAKSALLERPLYKLILDSFIDLSRSPPFDQVSCLQLRWTLVVLSFINPEFCFEYAVVLLNLLDEIQESGQSHQQAILISSDIARALVTATGPDDQSMSLASNFDFTLDLFRICLSFLKGKEETDGGVTVYLLSACINLIDRSEKLRDDLGSEPCLKALLFDFCAQFTTARPSCKNHIGLMLALIMKGSPGSQALVTEHVAPSDLLDSVNSILSAHHESGQLTESLEITLTGLIQSLESMPSK